MIISNYLNSHARDVLILLYFNTSQNTIKNLKRDRRGLLIESEFWLQLLCAVREAYGTAAVDVYINKELRRMNYPTQRDHIRTSELLEKVPEFDILRAQASLSEAVEESELSDDENIINRCLEDIRSPAPVLSQGRVLFARAMCLQQEALELRKSRSVESRRWSCSPEMKTITTPTPAAITSPIPAPPPTTPARVPKTRSPWVEGWADYWCSWKSKNTPISRRRSLSAPSGYRK